MTPKHSADHVNSQLLARILQADNSPAQLAAELNMGLEDLSRWMMNHEHIRLIEGLARLADVQAQVMLSRYRTTAAAHLIAIAVNKDPTELSRKACVDLLTTNLDVFTSASDGPERGDGSSSPPVPSTQAILDAFERLGAAANITDES